MLQFVRLLNAMTSEGAEQFAAFLNHASSSDAGRLGQWLRSASDAQVREAAALLNAGRLDDFQSLVGIGGGFWAWLFGPRKPARPAPADEAAPEPVAADNAVRVPCPRCGHRLKFAAEHAGKKAKCSQCGEVFRLPAAAAASQADPPAPPRWDVTLFGKPVKRPDLACHFCGDDQVCLGHHGSHWRCVCGAIYCRRNCQLTINGGCPGCGGERADFVEG